MYITFSTRYLYNFFPLPLQKPLKMMYSIEHESLVVIMKTVKQAVSLPIEEIKSKDESAGERRHGILLPPSIRAIICGPSSCGKTNLLMNLLYNKNGLVFQNIYLYSKSRYQPKYQELERVLEMVPEIGYFPFDDNDSVIQPNEAKNNSIFIFDDVSCEKQGSIREFFCMGRHKKIDSVYLAQTYTRIPKHLVRDNANLIVLFKQDFGNVKHVYFDHVNTDMTFNRFCEICRQCWASSNYSCLVIDKTSELNAGRYRRGFDEYIITE